MKEVHAFRDVNSHTEPLLHSQLDLLLLMNEGE